MSLKTNFRNIKKLPDILFLPLALLLEVMIICMRTEVRDLYGFFDTYDSKNYITVTWHNRILFFPVFFPRKARKKTVAIISSSRDGQYIVDVLKFLGLGALRGSSSKKGVTALKGATKALKKNCNVSITPDGPRGPRYKMSPGPIALASISGAPILPISINASSYWQVKSWDKFQIPKPWAKLTLVIGAPIDIPPLLSKTDFTYWQKSVEDKLLEITVDRYN